MIRNETKFDYNPEYTNIYIVANDCNQVAHSVHRNGGRYAWHATAASRRLAHLAHVANRYIYSYYNTANSKSQVSCELSVRPSHKCTPHRTAYALHSLIYISYYGPEKGLFLFACVRYTRTYAHTGVYTRTYINQYARTRAHCCTRLCTLPSIYSLKDSFAHR